MVNGRDENGRQQMSSRNTKFYSSFPGTVASNNSSLSCKTCKDNNGKTTGSLEKLYWRQHIRKEKHKADS